MEEAISLKDNSIKDGKVHEFSKEHALNLLRMQEEKNRKDWVIFSKDWEFKNNEISRRKRSTSSDKKA